MDNQQLLEFLDSRNITDVDYISYIKTLPHEKKFKLFSVSGADFILEELYGNEEDPYQNLIAMNLRLFPDDIRYTVIGRVAGDDLLCFEAGTNTIVLWLLENGDGEWIHVADSFIDFWKMAVE